MPGSWIGTSPRLRASTLAASMSTGDHAVPELGEAGGRHQAHPADSDHADGSLFAHLSFDNDRGCAAAASASPCSLRVDSAMPNIWPGVSTLSSVLSTQ